MYQGCTATLGGTVEEGCAANFLTSLSLQD